MKEYEVTVEYYDYIFTQSQVKKFAVVKAENIDEAKSKTYWKFGDLIDIIEIVEVK
jgi:hypothetical protein